MPIYFDTDFSFDDPQVKAFLFNKTLRSYTRKPAMPDDFEHDVNDRRSSGAPRVVVQDVTFLVEEHWQLLERGNATGVHKVVVALQHHVEITAAHWGQFKKGFSAAAVQQGRWLLTNYDPAQHGTDVEQWAANNLGPDLGQDDFILDTAITITKTGDPIEINVDQREALHRLFGLSSPPLQSDIPTVGDYPMSQWGRDNGIQLIKIHEQVVIDDGETPPNPNTTREVGAGTSEDPAIVGPIIDDVLSAVVPTRCGDMRREQFKLLILATWPEFKLEWKRIRIRVGCSIITISIPILRARISKLVFYVYYSLPRRLPRFVFKIAETCAIRSALASSIIGIVTTNIAAAIGSFTPLFKRCIEREVTECIHPGLLVLKEVGSWS